MEETKIVKLCSVGDRMQAEMILDILEQNGIHAYRESVGSGGILDIYGGNSVFGEEIFIREEDALMAQELTWDILHPSEDEKEEKIRRRSPIQQAVVFAILFVGIIVILSTLIVSLMSGKNTVSTDEIIVEEQTMDEK